MNDVPRLVRIGVTVLTVLIALFVVRWIWIHYELEPWTRDGRVRADTVEVAPDISGLVVSVNVHDNSPVRRGEVLFLIDPVRYRLALEQAEAAIKTDQAALDEAKREAYRNRVLGKLVSVETADQTRTARRTGRSRTPAGDRQSRRGPRQSRTHCCPGAGAGNGHQCGIATRRLC